MLKSEIDYAKRSISTDVIQISVGEIASMYEAEELNILPEFQRLFRWGPQKKSDFIESLLIGIPVPPAFAYENSDATWELIDGLQRISTILEFMGILRDPEDNESKLPSSTLVKTKYLASLDGMGWDHGGIEDKGIGRSFQLFLRRARISFQILKHPSDHTTKFDLFQRLNRGGAYANAQEVRTCSMVLANREFTRALREYASSDEVREVFRINKRQADQQRDLELLIRTLCHVNYDYIGRQDVEEFLDDKILELLQSEERQPVFDKSVWAIHTLHQIGGENALVPINDGNQNLATRFSLRSLEVIVVGIARNMNFIVGKSDPSEFITRRISEFWADTEAVDGLSGRGQRGTTRWGRSIPFGEEWFSHE